MTSSGSELVPDVGLPASVDGHATSSVTLPSGPTERSTALPIAPPTTPTAIGAADEVPGKPAALVMAGLRRSTLRMCRVRRSSAESTTRWARCRSSTRFIFLSWTLSAQGRIIGETPSTAYCGSSTHIDADDLLRADVNRGRWSAIHHWTAAAARRPPAAGRRPPLQLLVRVAREAAAFGATRRCRWPMDVSLRV